MYGKKVDVPNLKAYILTPPRILALGFLILITIGTVMLKLSIATDQPITWLTALFTATSASTVTGLIVVDTGSAFTTFGEIVILCMIQIGGLGIMTFAVLIVLMLRDKIGFRHMLIVQQALNQASYGGIVRLVKLLFFFSMVTESIAIILLSFRFVPEMGLRSGVYNSIFHTISAFNNAGFSLWSDGLMRFVGDPVVNLLVTVLFIIGGIGFTVIIDIYYSKSIRELSLHTKLMLLGTVIINVISVLLIFALEFDNPKTIGDMPLPKQLLASYFQGVTPRTAGFNTLDTGSMEESSLFLTIILMFVGAGSTSTGGGIKLTTFIALILSVITFIKGKHEAVILNRTISDSIIIKAFAITIVSLAVLFVGIFILMVVEDAPFLPVLFEAISAFGTVGLSMGITGDLSNLGQFVIILIMIFGKLGPLTLLFTLTKPHHSNIRYPKGDIITG